MGGNTVRRTWCCVATMTCLTAVPVVNAQAHAQRVATTISERTTVADRSMQRITVNLDDVPVRTAVATIARQADLRLSYNIAIIPVDARVTMHADNIPVTDAFRRVLSGTGLIADIQTTGNVLIARDLAAAADNGIVIGVVTNAKTKQPILNATILVDDASKGVQTDDDGRFRITLSAGEHTIHVRALGMARQSKRVTVTEGQTVSLAFALDATASVLDEVVVTGTVVATERKAISTPITVITAQDIEKRGITRIEQLLRGEVPGVVALDKGIASYEATLAGSSSLSLGSNVSTSVYVRGASTLDGGTTPLKTYVDGVEILNSSYLGTIDPKSIERIEIITGPQAATVYGSGAMGGVMQIFTKAGNGQNASTLTINLGYGLLENSFSSGTAPTHNHTASLTGGSGPSFSYSANGGYTYSGQWQPGLFSRQYSAAIGAVHTRGPLTVNGSVTTSNGRNGTTTSGWPLAFRKMGEIGEWGFLNVSGFLSSRVSTSATQTVALNLDFRATPLWSHHLTVGKSQTAFAELPNAPEFKRPADSLYSFGNSNGQRTTVGYNTTLTLPPGHLVSSTLTLGINGSKGNEQQVQGCALTKDATSLGGCSASGRATVQLPFDDQSWGGFSSLQVGLFSQLYFTFGLRAERNPDYGGAHKIDWTPTNGVAYTFEVRDLTIKLLGSYGSATRAPSPDQRLPFFTSWEGYEPALFLARLPNPNLTPEHSRGPQGGIELYYGNLGSLTVNHYSQKVTDLIQWLTVDTLRITCGTDCFYDYAQGQYRNVATIRQQGWEATSTVSLGPVTARGTYSWFDSRILQAYDYYVNGSMFIGVPTHTGNISLSYARGRSSVNFSTNFIGKWIMDGGGDMNMYATNNSRLTTYLARKSWPYYEKERPAYVKSDLAMSHQITSWITAKLNVNNVANSFTSNVREYYPTLGRQTTFGMSLRFPK